MTELQKTLDGIWPGWTIEESLGKGAYGTVYRIVREDKFGHKFTAALKVINIPDNEQEYRQVLYEGLDEESATDYFQGIVEDVVDEIVLMSQLKGNTNIVSYEDHTILKSDDSIQWKIFIRMELLTPLYDYMRDHELSIRDVIRLGIEMCNALELCQRYNIIHRDIKPDNIFVSDIGRFKLGDFGIARQLEKTSTGLSKKGTHSYMAPEVYKGEAYNSTVDIYSLGMVLYRLLNNNRGPFMPSYPERIRYSDRERANILRMSGKPLPLPEKAEGRLGEIILKACSYDPDKRYESAIALREALGSVLYEEEESDLIFPAGDGLESQKEDNYYFRNNESESGNPEKDEATEALHEPGSMIREDRKKEATVTPDEKDILGKVEHTRALFEIIKEQPRQNMSISNVNESENNLHGVKDRDYSIIEDDRLNQVEETSDQESDHISYPGSKQAVEHEEVQEFAEVSDNASERALEEEVKRTERGRNSSSHTLALLLLVVTVLASLGLVCVSSLTIIDYGEENEVIVPDLQGKTMEEAEAIVTENNMTVVKNRVWYSDTVEKGRIISQSPKPGENYDSDKSIYVEVSKGKKPILVPDITHMSIKKAKKALEALHFKMDTGKDREGGYILSQDPKRDTEITKGAKVKVHTSDGPKPGTGAKLKFAVNHKEDDYDTNKKELDGSKTIYVHFTAECMEDEGEIKINNRIINPYDGVSESKFQDSSGEDITLSQGDTAYSYWEGGMLKGKYIYEIIERKTGGTIGRCTFTVK